MRHAKKISRPKKARPSTQPRLDQYKMPKGFRAPGPADRKKWLERSPVQRGSKIGKVELFLASGRWLSSWQAINFFGYTRLADGVFRLRKKFGFHRLGIIVTDPMHGVDRYQNPSHWGRYRWLCKKTAVRKKVKPVKTKK